MGGEQFKTCITQLCTEDVPLPQTRTVGGSEWKAGLVLYSRYCISRALGQIYIPTPTSTVAEDFLSKNWEGVKVTAFWGVLKGVS